MFPASIITCVSQQMSQTEYRVAKTQSAIKSHFEQTFQTKYKLSELADHVSTAAENGYHFCI